MMLQFDNLSVKIIGPKIGAKPSAPSGELIDGDGDGKCQEESGKWVPCPPGVSLAQKIKAIREKAAEKAAKIAEQAQTSLRPLNQNTASRIYLEDFVLQDEMDFEANYEADNPPPDKDDYYDEDGEFDDDKYDNDLYDWQNQRDRAYTEYAKDLRNHAYARFAVAFEYRFKDVNGREVETRISDVELNEYGDVKLYGSIRDSKTGETVAVFERSFSTNGEVSHDFLRVYDKGSGIASAFNAHNEILYRKMGMSAITVHGVGGGGWDGVVHWPRNGFNWQDPTVKDQFLNIVQEAIRRRPDQYTTEQRNEIIQLLEQARQESFYDKDSITAGDFLHLSPALTEYFRNNVDGLSYRREL